MIEQVDDSVWCVSQHTSAPARILSRDQLPFAISKTSTVPASRNKNTHFNQFFSTSTSFTSAFNK